MTNQLRPGDLIRIIDRDMQESYHPHLARLLRIGDTVPVDHVGPFQQIAGGADVFYYHPEGRVTENDRSFHFFASDYAELICGIGDKIQDIGTSHQGIVETIIWSPTIEQFCPVFDTYKITPSLVGLIQRNDPANAVTVAGCTCSIRDLMISGCQCGFLKTERERKNSHG